MSTHLLDAMAREGFEEVHAVHDRLSGLRAFIALHDTTRGPAFGGVRRWTYRNEREGLLDCLRLARAMTHKCALADLPAGGAKIVLLDRPRVDWRGAYEHLGICIERMAGRLYAGPDVGTGERELGWLTARTRYATSPGPEGPGLLAESTAEGVFRGIEACLVHMDGEVDWSSREVVIQGLGAVGRLLAARLVEHGVRVLGADVDEDRATTVAAELGLELLDPARALGRDCDVYAPCALGGTVHDLTVTRLRCRVLAGAANNVLAQSRHGDRLHEMGVLYAPDFVINCGALVRGTVFHLAGRREPVDEIGRRIGRTLARVLDRARAERRPPGRVAALEAEERIGSWRGP